MRRTIVLGALIAGLPASGGCDHACTLVGCGAAFTIDLERDAWSAGEYTLTVVADGVTTECAVTLPLDCDAPRACPAASEWTLMLEGCAVAPEQQRIAWIEVAQGNTPESITLQVAQDGAVIGEAAWTPVYSTSHPNGSDCESTCVGAPHGLLSLK